MKRVRTSGQSAVMTALLCGMLIVAIAMATNAGKLVTEKIAMQNAVDLAVFSGAATQAGYMNEMRDVNDKMWKMVNDQRKIYEKSPKVFRVPGAIAAPCGLSRDMEYFEREYPCGGCAIARMNPKGLKASIAEANLTTLRGRLEIESTKLERKNTTGRAQARAAAIEAANRNYPGTGGKLNIYKNGSGFTKLMDTKKAKVDVTYKGWCFHRCPPTYIPQCFDAMYETREAGKELPGWKFRDGGKDVTFVAGIENAVPASPYLDIGGYFRSTKCGLGKSPRGGRCPLDVYAAAAPYWGKLGSLDSFDRTGGGNQDWDDKNPMQADKANRLNNHRPHTSPGNGYSSGKYRDYRARFIGIFEDSYNMPNVPNRGEMKH